LWARFRRAPHRVRQPQLYVFSATLELAISDPAHPITSGRAACVALEADRIAIHIWFVRRITAFRGGTGLETALVRGIPSHPRSVGAFLQIFWAPAVVAAHGVATATVVVVANFPFRTLDHAAGLYHAQHLWQLAGAGIIVGFATYNGAWRELAIVQRVTLHRRAIGTAADVPRAAGLRAAHMVAPSAVVVVAQLARSAPCKVTRASDALDCWQSQRAGVIMVVAGWPEWAFRKFAVVVGIPLQDSTVWTHSLVFGTPARAAKVLLAPSTGLVDALFSWGARVTAAG